MATYLGLLVGCSSGAAPAIDATEPAIPTESAMAIKTTFTLSSTAFHEGGSIPKRHSCDGEDLSPALRWSGAPEQTASFALIVDDPDARGFVHWVAYNLPGGSSGELPEAVGRSTSNLAQGTNDFRRTGYGGPCPPGGTHRYVFSLFALDRVLELSGSPTPDNVRSAMEGHVLAQAKITGTYRRGG
jgi:hypothetical protein